MSDFNYQPVNSESGNIVEAGYDGAGRVRVRFSNGNLYEYGNDDAPVAAELYAAFAETFAAKENSSGSFFYKYIRPLPFRKIDEQAGI